MSMCIHSHHTMQQVPGFYDNVAPGLLDLAWSSIQSARAVGAEGSADGAEGPEEFSFEGYRHSLGECCKNLRV